MQIFYLVSLVLVVMIIGYLVGGIPTALIISEKMGIDIRKYGRKGNRKKTRNPCHGSRYLEMLSSLSNYRSILHFCTDGFLA